MRSLVTTVAELGVPAEDAALLAEVVPETLALEALGVERAWSERNDREWRYSRSASRQLRWNCTSMWPSDEWASASPWSQAW